MNSENTMKNAGNLCSSISHCPFKQIASRDWLRCLGDSVAVFGLLHPSECFILVTKVYPEAEITLAIKQPFSVCISDVCISFASYIRRCWGYLRDNRIFAPRSFISCWHLKSHSFLYHITFSCCGYCCDATNRGLGLAVALLLLEQKVLLLNVLPAVQASGAVRVTRGGWYWSPIKSPTLHKWQWCAYLPRGPWVNRIRN